MGRISAKVLGIKCAVLLLLTVISSSMYAQFKPAWSSLDQRETPSWWKDGKFGIFIHWGLYSVPAYAPVHEVEGVYEKYAEHYENRLLTKNKLFLEHHEKHYGNGFTYADFAPLFKAQYFNPDQWASLIQASGARYVVLTAKHHDGFTLWPSQHSPRWNSVEMGPHRDLVKDLSESVRKKGMHMGFYYSLLEWNHPLYKPATINEWVDTHMIPQLKDLVIRYQPEIIFADGEWDYNSKDLKSETFLAWLYNESPVKDSVVVNDRWGKETRSFHGDYYTTEYDLVHNEKGLGNKRTHPWEESRGMGTSYGYNRFETTADYSTSKQLIYLLIEKVGNGGNLLLNIGPTADGLIPVVMQERLVEMGNWLKVNGEAIYGTTAWSRRPEQDKNKGVFFTLKDDVLYVLCTTWPVQPIIIPGVKQYEKVSLLGAQVPIKSDLKGGKLAMQIPVIPPGELAAQHAWVFKVEGFRSIKGN